MSKETKKEDKADPYGLIKRIITVERQKEPKKATEPTK
jgi:hypothetical protein